MNESAVIVSDSEEFMSRHCVCININLDLFEVFPISIFVD